MKLIREILYKVDINSVVGNTSLSINKVEFDSRLVFEGDMYIAINGVNVNGHDFINQAVENGASCIVCENLPENQVEEIVYISVLSSRDALAIISSNYYENPSSKLNLIGVTGTNGKTTVSTLLFDLYRKIFSKFQISRKIYHPWHIYLDFEGTGGAPLGLSDRCIHPHSHIKRNLDL